MCTARALRHSQIAHGMYRFATVIKLTTIAINNVIFLSLVGGVLCAFTVDSKFNTGALSPESIAGIVVGCACACIVGGMIILTVQQRSSAGRYVSSSLMGSVLMLCEDRQ